MSCTYTTIIKKFGTMGEKTGWTYVEIPSDIAEELKPGIKTSYRVKGLLDAFRIQQIAILPMGDGNFIMPLNAAMRKALGKKSGYSITVKIAVDNSPFSFSDDFMSCLADEPKALAFFNTLPGSHQRYFSKWIESAKTISTKTKRITMAIRALAAKQGYGEMLRSNKQNSSV